LSGEDSNVSLKARQGNAIRITIAVVTLFSTRNPGSLRIRAAKSKPPTMGRGSESSPLPSFESSALSRSKPDVASNRTTA
jgi:hypothetical protein